jgi:IS30 family transposase
MYQPLTQEERAQIEILKRDGKSNVSIAMLLNRHKSTIGRELKRNRSPNGYHHLAAQRKANQRRQKPRYQKMTPRAVEHVESQLRQNLSPEQVSNTMVPSVGIRVSHERIYQHIARDKQNGGSLYQHLRINYKRRYRRRNRRKGLWRTKIPGRVDIDQRPADVENRQEVGHWEADLVQVGGGHLVTLVERSRRFLLVGSVSRKHAGLVHDEMLRLLRPFSNWVRTITYDNGAEFSRHEQLNQALGCGSFFARPYHSWERGSNENMNGLLRQYFPKHERGQQINSDKVRFVQDELNRRPRKTLGWKNPMESFPPFINGNPVASGT